MSYININAHKDGLKYLLLKDITEKELNTISSKLEVSNIIETFDLLHVPVFITNMFGGLMYKNNYATEYCNTYSSTFSQITTLSGFDFIQALYDFSNSMKSSWSKNFTFSSLDGSTNYFTIDYFLITDRFNIPCNFVLVLKENGLKHLYTTIDNALRSIDNFYFWILDNSMRSIYTNNSSTLLDFLNYDSLGSLNALLSSTKSFTVNKSDALFTMSVNKLVCDHQQMIVIKALKRFDNSKLELRNKELRSEKAFLLKELQHRVRNNIQTILSIVNLQKSKYINNQFIDSIYGDILGRLYSIASLNDFIYLKEASIVQLINNIFDINRSIYGKTIVMLNLDVVDFMFRNSLKLNYFGMMINELISNSFKHGFDDKTNVEHMITIKIFQSDNSHTFIYRDNGNGFVSREVSSIGLSLIDSFLYNLEVYDKAENTKGLYELKFSFYE
jgi:two-component sensor histidine kinase